MKTLLCLAVLSLGLLAQPPAKADVGQQVPDFELPAILLNGDGRTRLSEFRGSPVVLDFWGTR
jgi:hypothetical protein